MAKPPIQPHFLMILLLVAVAAVLRLVVLGNVPMTNDEQNYVAISAAPEEFASWQQQRDLQTAGLRENRQAHPMLFKQLNHYIVFPLFGVTYSSVRYLSAVAGVLAVLAMIWLSRELGMSSRAALLAGAFVALCPLHVRFARSGYLDSLFTLLLIVSLALVIRAVMRRSAASALAAGVALGLMLSTKISGPIFGVGIGVVAGVLCWRERLPIRDVTKLAVTAVLMMGAVFVVWNDPTAYFASAFRPTDPKYHVDAWGMLQRTILSSSWWTWLIGTVVFLLPATVLLLLRYWRAVVESEALAAVTTAAIIAVFCLPLLALHSPAFSGEHGLLPFVIPLGLLFGLLAEQARIAMLSAQGLGAVFFALLYGLNLSPLPYSTYYNEFAGDYVEYEFLRRAAREYPPNERIAINFGTLLVKRNAVLCQPQPVLLLLHDGDHIPQNLALHRVVDRLVLAQDHTEAPPVPGFALDRITHSGGVYVLELVNTMGAPEGLPIAELAAQPFTDVTFYMLPSELRRFAVEAIGWRDGKPLPASGLGPRLRGGEAFMPDQRSLLGIGLDVPPDHDPSRYELRLRRPHPWQVYAPTGM